jgi:hypothetical protein
MSTIYECDFPCGCHTQKFDPREWTLCERHESPQRAMAVWADYGAQVYRALERVVAPSLDRLDICAVGASSSGEVGE